MVIFMHWKLLILPSLLQIILVLSIITRMCSLKHVYSIFLLFIINTLSVKAYSATVHTFFFLRFNSFPKETSCKNQSCQFKFTRPDSFNRWFIDNCEIENNGMLFLRATLHIPSSVYRDGTHRGHWCSFMDEWHIARKKKRAGHGSWLPSSSCSSSPLHSHLMLLHKSWSLLLLVWLKSNQQVGFLSPVCGERER